MRARAELIPVSPGAPVKDDMALTQRLEIRQSHALVMTPQLMQAIKLLQLSNLDLAAYVEGELERNPLLERSARAMGRRSADAGSRSRAPLTSVAPLIGADGGRTERTARPDERLGCRSRGRSSCRCRCRDLALERRGAGGLFRLGQRPAPAAATTATTISKPSSPVEITLADHLAEQLALAVADPVAPHDRAISDRSRR